MSEELDALLKLAASIVANMTPEECMDMKRAQMGSFIRATASCEHGDPDWETCPKCLAEFAAGADRHG